MASTDPEEESFTFVDKRRVAADAPAQPAADTSPAVAPPVEVVDYGTSPATEPGQPFGGFETDLSDFGVSDEDADNTPERALGASADASGMQPMAEADMVDDADADPLGSYGLAAYVTGLIASDAWQKMGLIADPSTGKVGKDLNQARFSIDCAAAIIGVIEQNPVAAVPASLRGDLQRVLNDLRLNFVEQSKR